MMPLYGYTLAKEIREKKQRSSYYIPYCKIDERGCFKGYKAGADDYLNKPFDSEVLLMKIKAIIQRKALILNGTSST
jgi:DNA-binding response OmpR family regulator